MKGKHVSVFKFGAEARKTVQDKNESNDTEKPSNGSSVKFLTIVVRNILL